MKVQRLLLTAALLSILIAPVQAMEREEGGFDWPGFYFSCLDDTLYGTVQYTAMYHEVDTPSGIAHTVSNFIGTGYIYSPETMRTWTQRFAFPSTMTVHKGETLMLIGHEVYIPDDPHDPVFFLEQSYKLTVNANGELVVDLTYPDDPDAVFPDDYSRCVGTGKESRKHK